MQFSVFRHDVCHRGSFFHEHYALRITKRCLEEDLEVAGKTPFEALRDHPIVKAFVKDRKTEPDGGKTVGSEAGAKTLRRLGHQDDHRGVTWWDEENGVVWLTAYHSKHRSGAADDSFVYFRDLMVAGRIYPTADDFELLFEEEARYFLDFVEQDAQEALVIARERPGDEIEVVIGRAVGTTLVVEIVDTLEETFVVVNWKQVEEAGHLDDILLLLKAFYPDSDWEDWETPSSLPTRDLGDDEICFSHVHG